MADIAKKLRRAAQLLEEVKQDESCPAQWRAELIEQRRKFHRMADEFDESGQANSAVLGP